MKLGIITLMPILAVGLDMNTLSKLKNQRIINGNEVPTIRDFPQFQNSWVNEVVSRPLSANSFSNYLSPSFRFLT